MKGFYRSKYIRNKDKGKKDENDSNIYSFCGVTQFESTYARRAFPVLCNTFFIFYINIFLY